MLSRRNAWATLFCPSSTTRSLHIPWLCLFALPINGLMYFVCRTGMSSSSSPRRLRPTAGLTSGVSGQPAKSQKRKRSFAETDVSPSSAPETAAATMRPTTSAVAKTDAGPAAAVGGSLRAYVVSHKTNLWTGGACCCALNTCIECCRCWITAFGWQERGT